MQADVYFQSNSAAVVSLWAFLFWQNSFGGISTVVTGLNSTTTATTLTFGWTWNHAGSGTVQSRNTYINQVH